MLAFVQVDFTEVVLGHQPDEMFDHVRVERTWQFRFFLNGHRLSPSTCGNDVDVVWYFVTIKIGTNCPDGELTVPRRIAKPFDLGLQFGQLGLNRCVSSFGCYSKASLFDRICLGSSAFLSLLFQLNFHAARATFGLSESPFGRF